MADFWLGYLFGFVTPVTILYVAARVMMVRDAEMFEQEQPELYWLNPREGDK